MKKDLKTLALARLSGFRHKTVKVPEWGNVSVVLREPSAEAWYLWQEVLNGDGEDDDTLSVVAKYSAAIFLIPICISFDTAEKRRYATYLILNRRFSFEF
ncbi:hypothetical protein FM942_005078 [Escherichia coli]|nr:hypothetical protein [Escherichia coli]